MTLASLAALSLTPAAFAQPQLALEKTSSPGSMAPREELLAPDLSEVPSEDSAQSITGVWLSPDWILPGPQSYSEEETRSIFRSTLDVLQQNNINTIFFETWLRGYSVVPGIARQQNVATALEFRPGLLADLSLNSPGLPIYPHLERPYLNEQDKVLDPLQLLIDEAKPYGIAVHAWCHTFYWKMDNTKVMHPWYSGPSLWNDLLATWLRTQAGNLRHNPAVAPATLRLMEQAALIYDKTSEDRQVESLLNRFHIEHDNHPMGALLREALKAGATPPDFLLIYSLEDPFPAPRSRALRPIYLNPAHPVVKERLTYALGNIANHHPGLAGLHLDHFRYPVDGQGLPLPLGLSSGSSSYFLPAQPNSVQRYRYTQQLLSRRQQVLQDYAQELRRIIPSDMQLSAAVLPLYYSDRDTGNRFRLNGYDLSSQAWYSWPVDFVVPMMYGFSPHLINRLLRDNEADLEGLSTANANSTIRIYPGVSHWQTALNDMTDFVFFDMNFARDIKFEKNQTEDFNFQAQ